MAVSIVIGAICSIASVASVPDGVAAAGGLGVPWGPAVSVQSPSGSTNAVLDSISCTAVGQCEAVGADGTNGGPGTHSAIVASESNDTWTQARIVNPPPGGTPVSLRDLALLIAFHTATAKRLATYHNSTGQGLAMYFAVESGGVWGSAAEIPEPSNASSTSGNGGLSGISCTSVGNCAAVGRYFGLVGQLSSMENDPEWWQLGQSS